MANAIHPIEQHIEDNFLELFQRLDIRPDENGKANNLDAEIVEVSVSAGSPMKIYHGLGREPVGFVVLSKDEFGDIKINEIAEEYVIIEVSADMTLKGMIL